MILKLALSLPKLWNKPEVTSINDVVDVLFNIIKIALYAAGILAVVFVIYGGIQYITSAGDSDKVKRAKDTVINSVIGIVIVIFAYSIVDFIARKF